MIEIDVIGLACPIPVVRVQKAMATHATEVLLVKVDNNTAKEHVMRLAESKGYNVQADEIKDEIHLKLAPKH